MRRIRLSVVSPLFFVVLGVWSAQAAPASPVLSAGLPLPQQQQQQQQQPGEQGEQQQAPPPSYEETVVVTAERDVAVIGDVGSSVTVIGRDQIAASGARWLIDVLQLAPGVGVVRSGPPGTLTEVYLRGASSGHTLFLIDGVKLNSPAGGAYDAANLQLSADRIERIEIVRGPQSTLYGSQAIGGVINVITRQGQGAGTWGVEADGGSYDTGRVHTWASGDVDAVRYAGAVSFLDSGGFSAASEARGNTEPDGYRNVSYDARVDYEAEGGARFGGFVRGSDGEVMFDDFDFVAGPVDALGFVQDTRELYAAATAGYAGEGFSSDVQLSVSAADSSAITPGGFFTGFFLTSSIREIDWQNDVALPADHRLTAGIEYRREQAEVRSESVVGSDSFDESVDFAGFYVQDRFSVGDRAHLAAGARYERHSVFGGTWTGRLTASVDAAESVRVHGSVGTAFKAPTLNDLYFPGFANPDLEPEESTGMDIGIGWASAGNHADLTFFRNDITNLIQFDVVAGLPRNIGEVLAQGVEVAAGAVLGAALEVAGNYTFTSSLPDDTDDQLIRRARHQGGIRLTYRPWTALRTWGEVRFKAGRFDTAPGGRVEMDPYGIVNLAADYRIDPRFTLRGRIDNVFDTEFEELFGFGAAGASGYLGLTVTLTRH